MLHVGQNILALSLQARQPNDIFTTPIHNLHTMIWPRCTRLLTSSTPRIASLCPLSTASRLLQPKTPPPATSTSAAQPFSTPFTPSPAKTPGIPSSPSKTPKAANKGPARPRSSVLAGTPLRGIGYIKGQEGPVAKEDSEYPDWLWTLLDPKDGDKAAEGKVGDAFGKIHRSIERREREWESDYGERPTAQRSNRQNKTSEYAFHLREVQKTDRRPS